MKIKIGNIEKELELMNKLFITKNYSELVIRGQILIKTFPKIMPFYNFLGLSYKAIGKEAVAAKVFENAIFHDPNEISVITNLAGIYIDLNKLKESEELLNRALKIDDKDLYALNNYALQTMMKVLQKLHLWNLTKHSRKISQQCRTFRKQ